MWWLRAALLLQVVGAEVCRRAVYTTVGRVRATSSKAETVGRREVRAAATGESVRTRVVINAVVAVRWGLWKPGVSCALG